LKNALGLVYFVYQTLIFSLFCLFYKIPTANVYFFWPKLIIYIQIKLNIQKLLKFCFILVEFIVEEFKFLWRLLHHC